jgi:hypothetical protein
MLLSERLRPGGSPFAKAGVACVAIDNKVNVVKRKTGCQTERLP